MRETVPPDVLLSQACSAMHGDPVALEAFLGSLRSRIHLYLGRRVGDDALAEDLCQDALLHITRALSSMRAAGGRQFVRWCYVITANVLRDWYRSRRTDLLTTALSVDLVEHLLVDRPFTGTDHDQFSPIAACVRNAVASLTPEVQALLFRRLVRDQTWTEIGCGLGIKPSAAKRRFQRTQEKLRVIILSEAYLLPEPDRRMVLRRIFGETDGHHAAQASSQRRASAPRR